MPLVSYSSDTSVSGSDSGSPPPAKRLKSTTDAPSPSIGPSSAATPASLQTGSPLPPLPAAFHDLYASTVRTSTVDDPSLHHGRRRLTPHVAGNWPSHIYIEWHPTESERSHLASLITRARTWLPNAPLHTFLTSDLGSRLPLHISLSRPIALTTPTKESFLEKAKTAIRTSPVRPFGVVPASLAWYCSPDSNTSFLILRVESSNGRNDELAVLLRRCNGVVKEFGQPQLYALHKDVDACAFHISIAWTIGDPAQLSDAALQAGTLLDEDDFGGIKSWRIAVEGVKLKIGNKVTTIALGQSRNP